MTDKKKTRYLPFHAVNEFMRDDYRLTILFEVFSSIEKVTPELRQTINRMVTKEVHIPGFRNSNLAPESLKVKSSTSLFESSPGFTAICIEAWSRLHFELRGLMWNLLTGRSWEIPVLGQDLSKLPGFKSEWPVADTFESLIHEVREKTPSLTESDDDISLMAVWVGNCLPYRLFEEENE